jgi:hypothetical protein
MGGSEGVELFGCGLLLGLELLLVVEGESGDGGEVLLDEGLLLLDEVLEFELFLFE